MTNTRPGSNRPLPLRGRAAQVERITGALNTAAGTRRSRVILLESPAGSGKTRLLREAITLAEQRGFTVVEGWQGRPQHGSSVESRPPNACKPNACKPIARGPRPAAPDRDGRGRPAGPWEYRLTALLDQGPVLITVDDLHWLDAPALTELAGLASRFDEYPLVWFGTIRSGNPRRAAAALLDTLSRQERTEWLEPLGALPAAAVAEITGDLLDAVPHPDLLALAECLDTDARALVDLCLGLRQDKAIEIEAGIARLADGRHAPAAAAPAEPAPIPPRFLALMDQRLGALSEPTRRMMRVAAVLGSCFTPRDLSDMLAEPPAALLQPLAEALAAGMLVSRSEDFTFRRDPIWRAVLAGVPPPMLSLLHRQAATILLAREGASTEEAAAHLVHCAQPDDAEAIETITRTAHQLLEVAPDEAATLAVRGMEIAERGGPDHLAMASTAITALVRCGSLDRAAEIAGQIVWQTPNGTGISGQTAQAGLATINLLRGELQEALELTSRVCSCGDLVCSGVCIQLVRLSAALFTGDEATEQAAEDMLAAPESQCPDVLAAAFVVRAVSLWDRGRIDAAFAAVEQAAEQSDEVVRAYPLWQQAWMLMRLHRFDEADTAITALAALVEASRTEVLAAIPPTLRAWVRLGRGDLAGAEADATDALDRCHETRMALPLPALHAVLALTALRRGDLGTAQERVRALEQTVPRNDRHPLWIMRCRVAALVAAASSDSAAALPILLEVGDIRTLVRSDPVGAPLPVRLAIAAGRDDIARAVVRKTESIGAANPGHSVLARAANHARALLDRDAAAIAAIAEDYADPWVRAAALEDCGVLYCDTDRESAVAQLIRASTAYQELDADRDTARVRRRLRRLGVRRRHWNHTPRPESGWASLTATEEKVARLVARGLTNRLVARELFISPHTVGFHLRQIYRKLDVKSRVDLARLAP
ncbi:helix-turn-helix transcriptional regulator [Nocardia crassostreae]|uniref:helix-turn-helix transcriptional regulator n=1 Tax=Nocardia crassostreae TaxID=53428 RepID=UPI000831740F|nr:LuxR family transcriptional regulator [Nocardia crassostreae]